MFRQASAHDGILDIHRTIADTESMQVEIIRRRLGGAYAVEYFAEIESTNTRALQRAHEGAPAGTLIVADYQSAGRGRRGASWHAPTGTCVLCSLLLRPATALPPPHLAILTGVGAAHGLRELGIPARIKWPNDLMLEDRKVGGILVETAGDAVVVGVGINCAVEEFPEELRESAGSLHALVAMNNAREDVLVAVVTGLTEALARVETGGIIKVLYEWNKLNWLTRRKVRVSGPLGAVDGDGLFLDGRKMVFHVFKDYGVVTMPLTSTVEAL
ncbi:MAG: biotin--[acetyl-CoA-carboxylase] ligase [Armatimonadota bacterium]